MKNHLCHVAQARCEKQTILIADSQWNLITVGGIGLVDWRLPPNCSCPSQLIFIEAAPPRPRHSTKEKGKCFFASKSSYFPPLMLRWQALLSLFYYYF
jgi:hypothetical protein